MLITKEALKTLINGLVAKMQNYRGNWNQNDPTASDYIKNKPFYTEIKFAEILPETEWVGDPDSNNEVSLPNILNLETGKTYTINYNGIDYECIANDGAEVDFPGWYLGNISSFTGGADTGEPFIMLVFLPDFPQGLILMPLDDSTSGTLSISGDIKILKTIDEEYLGLNVKNGSGDSSVIEGYGTTASGDCSHAEGFNTTASYTNSHAEGYYTTASGNGSHAEGTSTTASGNGSHAEGGSTTASKYGSHAEGTSTTASGEASHAEGTSTTASGSYSHAEGLGAIASGSTSHAEGRETTASGDYQHVQGKYNISDITSAHIVGNGTGTSNRSNAHTLDWNGNAWFKGDVYVGSTSGKNKDSGSVKLATVNDVGNVQTSINNNITSINTNIQSLNEDIDSKLDKNNPFGTGSFSMNRLEASTIGDYSSAIGYNNIASGRTSHAEGYYTKASGVFSHAEGYYTEASGDYSHAEGKAFIDNSDSIRITGDANATTYTVEDMTSELFIKYVKLNKRIFCQKTLYEYAQATIIALDADNFTITVDTTLSTEPLNKEWAYLGEGRATGFASHAEGLNTIASGYSAHAEGRNTTASGYSAHAEGSGTIASENTSHAEGSGTTASGYDSHAEGSSTIASGDTSHAEGIRSIANGYCSHTEGIDTIANGDYQHVQGKYNIEDAADTYAHIVGNGTKTVVDGAFVTQRSNAHTLDWDGNAWFAGNIKIGGTGQDSDEAQTLTTQEYVKSMLNRTTSCGVATTDYSTYMARGEAMFSTETTPTYNGQIAWTYE